MKNHPFETTMTETIGKAGAAGSNGSASSRPGADEIESLPVPPPSSGAKPARPGPVLPVAAMLALALFAGAGAGLEGEPIQRFVRLGFPADGEPGTLGTVIRSEAIRADGAAIPVEISLGRTGDGKSRLYTAVVRDIGERDETEERITL